jgi:hypothetical protein
MSIYSDGSLVNTPAPPLYPNLFNTRRSGIRVSRDWEPPTSVWKRPEGKTPHTRIENSFWSSGIAAHLKPIPAAVFLYLRSLADENAQCWPSPRRIASEIGSSESSVKRALKLLKQRGLVHVGECFNDGTDENTTNLYTLLPLSSFRQPDQSEPTSGYSEPTKATEVGSHRTPNKNQLSFKQKTDNKGCGTRKPQDLNPQPAPDATSVVVVFEENKIQSNDIQNSESSQKEIEELVQRVLAVGIKPEAKARSLVLNTPIEKLKLQLDCLPDRKASDPAALLLTAVKGDFDPPRSYSKRIEMEKSQKQEKEIRVQQEILTIKNREEKKLREHQQEKQKLELDTLWRSLDQVEQQKIQSEARERVGDLAILRPSSVALEVERRNILRERYNFDCPKPVKSDGLDAPISFTNLPSTSRIEAIVWNRLESDDVGIDELDVLQEAVGAALDDHQWNSLKASVVKRWKLKMM